MNKILFLFLFMLPVYLTAQVTIKDTTITWHTFNYSLNNNMVDWYTDIEYDTISKVFSGYVIENEYLKITLVPEFGGRILSMIYKPTGKEQLYQNPAGTPYGIGQDWFYYSWLMVYGGIFPTLTEPEHGKAWFLPWEFTILKETTDTIRCRMSWTDTVDAEIADPGKWKYGKTNLRCDYIITLVKGASSLETDAAIFNDSNEDVEYEYWTCITLAPGSEPGNSKCTEGAELIIPATKVKIPAWYPDIARQEQRIPGENGIYTFTNLRQWKNWTNDGIAYPWNDTDENYWGVINHDNEEGLIRIADNNVTTGIKIWAWGYEQSQDIDPFKNPDVSRRPYVELWAGHSNEFFESAVIPGNSVKQWKEIYAPTTGLSNVTNASNSIIADLKIDNLKTINLGFVTTRPGSEIDITIELTGNDQEVLLTETIIPDPVYGNKVITDLPDNHAWTEEDSLICTIGSYDENTYLRISTPLNNIPTGIAGDLVSPDDFHLYQNYPNPFNSSTKIHYKMGSRQFVTIKVYDLLGKEIRTLVNEHKPAGNYEIELDAAGMSSGTYFYRIQTGGFSSTRKLVLLK
ncbi:MAG: DUF5107 domain-containing protein [Ignavibacteriaceae bacterium]